MTPIQSALTCYTGLLFCYRNARLVDRASANCRLRLQEREKTAKWVRRMQFRLIEFEDCPLDPECAIEIYRAHQFPTVCCRAVDLNFTEFHFRNDG